MNAIPAAVAAPALVLTTTVVVARWTLLRRTTVDRLINAALSWSVAGAVGYWSADRLGATGVGPQILLSTGFLATANIYGVAASFAGLESGATGERRRRLRNIVAAVIGAALLIVLSGAGRALSLDRVADWYRITWLASSGISVVSTVLIAWAALRELRRGGARSEQLAFLGLFAVAALAGTLTTVSIARVVVTGTSLPLDGGRFGNASPFLVQAGFALLAAVPLGHRALERFGLDRAGRDRRLLRPMWRDVTAAVPEVVLHRPDDTGRDSAARRYRMQVEILDALVRLRRYAPGAPPDAADAAGYARWIASAVAAKSHGAEPDAATAHITDIVPTPVALMDIARRWEAAAAREAISAAPASPR